MLAPGVCATLRGYVPAGNVAAYLPLVIPGILVQSVLTGSSATGTQVREDMDKGVFDRFRTLPMARSAPLAGALTADTVRYLIAITITMLIGAVLGGRPGGGVAGVAGAVLLVACAWAPGWIFAYLGVISRSAAGVQGISILVLFPLTFLSNACVPVDTLPDWLQRFVAINPVTHLINALRDLLGLRTFGQAGLLALAGAACLVVVMASLTVRVYKSRVWLLRRPGAGAGKARCSRRHARPDEEADGRCVACAQRAAQSVQCGGAVEESPAVKGTHMPDSSPTPLNWREAGFDQMCHDLKNPLMVIRGRAQLVERAILRSTALPAAERAHVLHSLAAIEAAVLGIVEMIDAANPARLVGGGEGPPCMGPHSS